MKILARSREDILRDKEAWQKDFDERTARHEEQYANYKNARKAIYAPIKQEIESHLAAFTALQFEVRVEGSLRDGIEVQIQCNERNKFEDDVALSWNYTAVLEPKEYKDGSEPILKKETGSWSGLKAVTEAQMNSLRQSVSALEYLNGIDWFNLLNKKLPQYQDYVTEHGPDRRDPGFDAELRELDYREIVGDGKYYLSKDGRTAYSIVNETPKFYRVIPVQKFYFGSYSRDRFDNWPVENMRKDKLYDTLAYPFKEVNPEEG